MPISLLEAMSYGRNCLISDIDENTQVCGEYATVFKHGDLNDLEKKLDEVFRKQKRFDGDVISDYILKKYNWNEVVEKTEKLYKGIER
jgi:glycosyltransferase involved in cell wall biosynthesis